MNIDELRELLQMLLGAGIKPMLCTQNVPVSGESMIGANRFNNNRQKAKQKGQ